MRRTFPLIVSLLAACGAPPDLGHDGGGGGTGGGGGGTGGGAGGGTVSGFHCTNASLFAGNPLHNDPMMRPADGAGLLEDPPFPYRTVLFSNGQLITHMGQEIWRASLSDKKLHKLAGTESVQQALITGACANARFANIFGIALASDGSLFVSDQTANAILKVTDPLGAGCTVSHWAGTPMDIPPGTITPANPPNVGNVDGPGAMAKFGLPERMALDGSDNVYVWDNDNGSIRKIANDATHTVSTLATGFSGAALFETFLAGKVYVYGKQNNDVFIVEVDASSGAKRDVLRGRADKFGGSSSDSQTNGGIVNDGSALIVFFNGQLFRVTTTGTVSAPLAGTYRPGLDFPSGYDAKAPHAAADLVVPSSPGLSATAGVETFLTLDANKDLYLTASKLNGYVLKVDCE